MLGHGGPADRKRSGDLADGARAIGQLIEDGLPRGIPECGEHRSSVRHDER
jgi:hypothetical protein